MKAIILRSRNGSGKEGATNHSKNGCKSVKPPSFPPRKFTKAHLHELLSKLISETSLSDDNETAIPEAGQDPESTLLVNSASANAANPGDIRKLMSEPGKNKGAAVKIQTAFANEVTINGKTCRERSQHVTYCITTLSRSSLHSLLDRGANGGVTGSDARVIETHPDRKVDIHGIDNHELTAKPLVTAGGVRSTIAGEVILIMHQYAYHGKNKTIHSSSQVEHCKNIVDDCSIKVGSG